MASMTIVAPLPVVTPNRPTCPASYSIAQTRMCVPEFDRRPGAAGGLHYMSGRQVMVGKRSPSRRPCSGSGAPSGGGWRLWNELGALRGEGRRGSPPFDASSPEQLLEVPDV